MYKYPISKMEVLYQKISNGCQTFNVGGSFLSEKNENAELEVNISRCTVLRQIRAKMNFDNYKDLSKL